MGQQFERREDFPGCVHIVGEQQQGGHVGLLRLGIRYRILPPPDPPIDGGEGMPETTAMASVSFHYWAGARAVAGVEEETFQADTIAGALRQATEKRADPRFSSV